MKRQILLLLLSMVVCCCTKQIDVDNAVVDNQTHDICSVSFLTFNTEQSLWAAINNQTDNYLTKATDVDGIDNLFTPIDECEITNDPIISFELARVGNNEWHYGQSLYEVLHYDDMVPNENFARLINVRGEFRVGDTIYKISPRGTYYYPASLHNYFIEHYAEFEFADGTLVSEKTYQLAPSIMRYDTFGETFEDEDWSCSADQVVQTKADPYPPFNWNNYPIHTGTPDNLFSNDVFTYSLPTQRRIKTCVFHNNYVVYQERGIYIKCQKKVTLGWSDVTSKALAFTVRNTVFQRPLSDIESPTYQYLGWHTETLPLEGGGTIQLIVIQGLELTQNQINSIAVGGASSLRTIIMNAVGVNVSGYDLVRLYGSHYVQTIDIGPHFYINENEKKLRELFDSNWFGGTAQMLGGQVLYTAIDDLEDFGALRVGNSF